MDNESNVPVVLSEDVPVVGEAPATGPASPGVAAQFSAPPPQDNPAEVLEQTQKTDGAGPVIVVLPPFEPAKDDSKNEVPITVLDNEDFAQFKAEVLKSPIPVLVDCWSLYCLGCRLMDPLVDQAAVKFAGRLKVGKLNVSKGDVAFTKLNVMAIPTVILFKDGQEVWRVMGYDPEMAPTMLSVIEAYL